MKKIIHAIVIILLISCGIFLKINWGLIFMNPFSVGFGDIVYATRDSLGNQIVIDASGQRMLKADADSRVDFVVRGAKRSGEGFYEAKKALTDADNHIYVLNILKEEGGYRVQREEIVEYSPQGKYLGIVVAIDHEAPQLTESIVGLYNVGGELSYIISDEDSFTLYDRANSVIHTYESAGTRLMTASYAIEPDTGDIYYCTKKGQILKYTEAGEDTLLYDANAGDELSIPRDLSFDPEGNLYFTDIGLRTVSKLNKDGTVSHVIYDGVVGEDTADKYIYYYCDASHGVVAVTSDYTVAMQDGEAVYGEALEYSSELRLTLLAVWTAIIVTAVILTYLLIRIARLIMTKGSKVFRIAAGVILGVSCIAGVFLLIVLPDFEERLLESTLQRAQVVSDVTVMTLPMEEFKSLDSTSDFMGEDYIAVRNSINKLYLSDSKGIEGFYCVLYTIRDGIITCTYALQEDTGAVYPYDWTYEGSDEQWIISHKEGKVYKGLTSSEGSYLFVLNPILDNNGDAAGLIEVGTDLNSFHEETNRMILELLLHIIVITIVVVLIAWELIIFIHGRSVYQKNRLEKREGILVKLPNELLRLLVFGIFFITNMTTSFLPLYAMEVAKAQTGLAIPKEVLAAIPISAEVLFGAIFSVMGNVIIKLFGLKKSAIIGSILFTVGLSLRFLMPNIWMLTAGNAVMGSGWGILLLIVNTVIATGDDEEKNKGFAGYSAAALNGVNCGIVFGGFLVNWLNHITIFMLAAALSLLILVHVSFYLAKASYTAEVSSQEAAAEPISLFRFFAGKGVLKFFLMIVIPVIACSYFLNYMFPILGSEYGLSETKVGYSYLINGLCVICFGSILTEQLSKRIKKAYSLVFASLLYAAAFLCVAYFRNVFSLIVVLVLLGLSDSFGLPLQTSHFTDLEAVKKYGYEKSMGIYSLFENAAQSGGSFLFSYVLLIGVKEGLYLVAAIVGALAVLFGIICFVQGRVDRRRKKAMA
jgi:predicted MFS family arabinose efflux permease